MSKTLSANKDSTEKTHQKALTGILPINNLCTPLKALFFNLTKSLMFENLNISNIYEIFYTLQITVYSIK